MMTRLKCSPGRDLRTPWKIGTWAKTVRCRAEAKVPSGIFFLVGAGDKAQRIDAENRIPTVGLDCNSGCGDSGTGYAQHHTSPAVLRKHGLRRPTMPRLTLSILSVAPLLWTSCGGSIPPPTQRLADAQAAERSARELGADKEPAAQLSLKLAQDQIALAQAAMKEDENERAESLLLRAKADAELAIAQARERTAKIEGQEAINAAAAQKATNALHGAVK
jgi:hypothetical protein